MVNTEERFKQLQDKQAELEGSLDAARQDILLARQETQESSDRLMAAMAEMRSEMMELLRLNRPAPPVVGQTPADSTMQGRGMAAPEQGECSNAPERRRIRTVVFPYQNVENLPRGFERNLEHHQENHIVRLRADFPEFDYQNPRLWIRRLERYFMISQIHGDLYLDYLTLHLYGKVGVWFEGYVNGLRGGFHWGYFVEAICRRFGLGTVTIDEEFMTLRQVGTMEEFTEKYEEIRSILLQEIPYLTEEYFLNNYVCRLKMNIRCSVRAARPWNLEDAVWLAKNFEQGMRFNELATIITTHPRGQVNKITEISKMPTPNLEGHTNNTNPRNAEIEKLREQRLCFNCRERWQYGHKCKAKGSMAVVEGCEIEEDDELQKQGEGELQQIEGVSKEVEVSLNTIV